MLQGNMSRRSRKSFVQCEGCSATQQIVQVSCCEPVRIFTARADVHVSCGIVQFSGLSFNITPVLGISMQPLRTMRRTGCCALSMRCPPRTGQHSVACPVVRNFACPSNITVWGARIRLTVTARAGRNDKQGRLGTTSKQNRTGLSRRYQRKRPYYRDIPNPGGDASWVPWLLIFIAACSILESLIPVGGARFSGAGHPWTNDDVYWFAFGLYYIYFIRGGVDNA